MTNEQILQKAIEKAIKNGMNSIYSDYVKYLPENAMFACLGYERIFSHDFARAFWGEEIVCRDCGFEQKPCNEDGTHKYNCDNDNCYTEDFISTKAWRYHLQQLVLKPEPLKYLEKFLEE